jgi:hypothetical protein
MAAYGFLMTERRSGVKKTVYNSNAYRSSDPTPRDPLHSNTLPFKSPASFLEVCRAVPVVHVRRPDVERALRHSRIRAETMGF